MSGSKLFFLHNANTGVCSKYRNEQTYLCYNVNALSVCIIVPVLVCCIFVLYRLLYSVMVFLFLYLVFMYFFPLGGVSLLSFGVNHFPQSSFCFLYLVAQQTV